MADFFGAIASNEINFNRAKMINIPPKKCNTFFEMSRPSNSTPFVVPKKMTTKEELDIEINKLKEHYSPFMRVLSPKLELERTRFDIKEFDYRLASEEDTYSLNDVLDGKGEWEKVTIPHFGGPVGDSTMLYRTTFNYSKDESSKHFIHFNGVDYIAQVFLNKNFVGENEGFFAPFEFDITKYLVNGENTLLVIVKNDYPFFGASDPNGKGRFEGDKLYAATGPGYDEPVIGWHHCPAASGIYQNLYIEKRNKLFISDLYVRPLLETKEYEIWCEVYNCDYIAPKNVKLSFSLYGKNFEATVLDNYTYTPITFDRDPKGNQISIEDLNNQAKIESKKNLVFYKGKNLVRLKMKLGSVKKWDLNTPYLYDLQVKLIVDDEFVDNSSCTFGMRSFYMDTVSDKKGMFYLNGNPIRLRGANTMGFEQQDVMKGDFDQLLYDMLMAKACNMNFLRLTQRPVQKEIYELCSSIGLMIQTDLPLFTNIRRTKFAEVIRQAEEMERLVRPYPCCVLNTYINEPFPNGNGLPHRHFVRYEVEQLFTALDTAIHLLNPDRVIKHIDGDYDPPSNDLPDYHTYTMWYNGHGIDMGRVYRGYWLDVPEDWYCGCGEYGSEGLDPVDLMRRRYPKSWLPQTLEEEKSWDPGQIVDSQSGNMFYFFYDRQDNLEDWVTESHKHQVVGTKVQTEAFRRNSNMVTFAIHLFIDAFPSGWMKTLVDCERNPKPAFFTYRDALTPLMVSVRNDRKSFMEGENATAEIWICNDTVLESRGHKLVCEVIDSNNNKVYETTFNAKFESNSSFLQGKLSFVVPKVNKRDTFTIRAILLGQDNRVIHYNEEQVEIFEKKEYKVSSSIIINNIDEYINNEKDILTEVENGKTLVINSLKPGEYNIAGSNVTVKSCGMRPLHFVSRKTGHELVKDYGPYDFRFWYSEKDDMITPLIRATFRCDDFNPILISGNNLKGSAWGQKLYSALACAEKNYGKGKIIINQVDLDNHLLNPIAKDFKNKLETY